MPADLTSGRADDSPAAMPTMDIDRSASPGARSGDIDDRDRDLLRRLVIADPRTLDEVLASHRPSGLDRRTELLMKLAAAASVDAGDGPSVSASIEACLAAGASESDVAAVVARVRRI